MQVCVNTVTLPCLRFCTYMLTLIKIYFLPNPVQCRAQSPLVRVQIKVGTGQYRFPIEKRDSLSRQSCIFRA